MLTKRKIAKFCSCTIALYLFMHALFFFDSGMLFGPDERVPFLMKRARDNMGFLSKVLRDKPQANSDDVKKAVSELVWKDTANAYECTVTPDVKEGWVLRANPQHVLTYKYPLIVRALFFRWEATHWPIFTLHTSTGKYVAHSATEEPR